MTTDASVSSSSSSLNRAERGRNKKHRGGVVFDAAAAACSEDDPLLQEPLLVLPTNLQPPIVPSLYSHDDYKQEQAPPSSHSHDFRVFTKSETKRVIRYESDSHVRVLFQMYGSVWPAVLPYCIVSVSITAIIAYLQSNRIVDLTFASSTGHSFMAIMVSFLVVTRANITYARYMESRQYLSDCYRNCRELVQHVCILTLFEDSPSAQEWRRKVAYQTILLLRVTMAAIEFRSSSINTWDVTDENLELLTPTTPAHRRLVSVMPSALTPQNQRISKWAHGERTMADENFRAPIVLAYNLRQAILVQRNGEYLEKRMHVNEELKILGFVSDYVTAFHGLKKLITAPFPFPLVQMTRTFLFFWVFSLPLVLVHAIPQPVQVMVIMFFVTYGFLGLEYVSMELDDPFGDDPNDFDDLGMAEIVFEDIYISLYKRDGLGSAEILRDKVVKRESKGDALKTFHDNFGE
jgi:predicted membrane chloride channel (bestrophin family)